MNQETRNKLQRATQQVRSLLEREFAEQLEGTFDILPDGTILSELGKHLDSQQRLVRQKLVESIEHIKAGGKNAQEAVDEYTREAAFTFLNRFVALRMLEARGFLQECVSKGDRSSGFREFCGLAPGLTSLPDGGYQLYLECLFDELSVEIKVLFDRGDSASLLWPRRGALSELLEILGQEEFDDVWSEDEAIGWVYQYFNSNDERRQMREASSSPRNSRELAVRNQFFTPRYVVAFLTDNTLGRIWYEMQKGETRLTDLCQYLFRWPCEVFLDEGQEAPVKHEEVDNAQELSQVEILKHPVYVPHRSKKDPRDIKILDPACGSGHFLLYAFDLLISIYEEAWHDEASPKSEVTGARLRSDYEDLTQLHLALPGLVLRYNLYGIDIDARAAQIAALALWMRGQRASNAFGVPINMRQVTGRSNIICAEAMPGEESMLNEFLSQELSGTPEKTLVGQLVRRVFDEMDLAGEAGPLLKIEDEIGEVISDAKKQWSSRPKQIQQTLFSSADSVNEQLAFDVSGITDESFWEHVEQLIYLALIQYSEDSDIQGYQKQLFSEDSVAGFSFIDVCRGRYDVVLMNPPFGPGTERTKPYLSSRFPSSRQDMATCFVERALQLCNAAGVVGAITTRTPFFLSSLGRWRNLVLEDCRRLTAFADLGYGVLDAVVETAAYCLSARPARGRAVFLDLLDVIDKRTVLHNATLKSDTVGRVYTVDPSAFAELEGSPALYWCPESLLQKFRSAETLEPTLASVKRGVATGDNFRFLRLWAEVGEMSLGAKREFIPYAKGGEYAPYFFPSTLLLKWREAGLELRNLYGSNGRLRSRPQNIEFFGLPGLAYPSRTTSGFGPRLLQSGCGFDQTSNPIIPTDNDAIGIIASILMSRLAWLFVELQVGMGDTSQSGTAARDYTNGLIGRCPIPALDQDALTRLRILGEGCITLAEKLYQHDEMAPTFRSFFDSESEEVSFEELVKLRLQERCEIYCQLLEYSGEADQIVCRAFQLSELESDFLDRIIGPHPSIYTSRRQDQPLPERIFTKKCFWANAALERVCHHEKIPPHEAIESKEFVDSERIHVERNVARDIVSWGVGATFGRWPRVFENENRSEKVYDMPWSVRQARGARVVPILVDDRGCEADFTSRVEDTFREIWGDANWDSMRQRLLEFWQEKGSFREFLRKEFFEIHRSTYTQHSRSAPIYWQLSTPSHSYSIWLYYHSLTKDTFFKVLNDYVKPKLEHERQKIERLRSAAGAEPTRSQLTEMEEQEKFVAELACVKDEIARVAPMWSPNLDDGIVVNFAPLWRLLPHNKPWQTECKKTWESLLKGEFDWAHLAMHLWPERVVPKCVTDASLAIAHGLEEVFWWQDERDRLQPRDKPDGGWGPTVENLVKERISPAVKAALQSLLDAPVTSSGTNSTRRRGRATA